MTLCQSLQRFGRVGRWVLPKSHHESITRSFSVSTPLLNDTLRRSAIFTAEKKRQHEAVGRINKIEVEVTSDYGNELLLMNRDISTPHDCAKHISGHLTKNAFVALVNTDSNPNQPWDMHKPLSSSCRLQFLKTTDKNPWIANNTFWRSCSFMLGAVVSKAFRDDIAVILHSFPSPNVYSGSFILDAFVGLESWNPSPEELRSFSADMVKLSGEELPFEYLSVSREIAEDMFSDNPYKRVHIGNIFENHNEVVVYRVGDHVDISRGPMMNHTGLLGRCTIASVHYLEDDQLFRFQGVALPIGHKLNHYAYGILENRAKFLNDHMIPSQTKFQPAPEYATEATKVN
ncbi:39S ribosomal protein L39, mitochondrial [Thrips palmi]|uniref:39S ribosomal protein L39, mitochondrial n=1 Tax=Thrips palmi TaxID=161013 RepID=A0A6P8ZN87_THRPL|nr:39S ribosomal protein L39, mitochondrial [Thrips palmi]